MSELKIRRENENLNEAHELKNLLNNLNLEQENHMLNRPDADDLVTKRLELQKPAVRPKEIDVPKRDDLNVKEFDEKYLEKLKVDLKECNPNYNLGREWKINCQRCVPTFEMRRRGYDVTTKPRGNGLDYLAYNPFGVWKNPEVITADGNGKRDIENKMAQWGDGARAQVVVMWKGAPMGHTFFAEQVNGKTRFYDPQNGSMDVTDYFNRVAPGSVRFCRVDNLEPSDKMKDCFRKV